jgi:uncharacterized protein involved in exopolysaccharide biosynthesis
MPNLGIEYFRKLRELKIQETIFEQLSKQYEISKINEAKDSSTIQILDEAVVPAKKSKPKRSLIVLLATFSAFIGSIVTILLQDYLSKLPPEDSDLLRQIKEALRPPKS